MRASGADTTDALFCTREPSVTRLVPYREWQYASVSGELEILLWSGSAAFGYMIQALQENGKNITQSFWRVNNFIEFSNLSLSCPQDLIFLCPC